MGRGVEMFEGARNIDGAGDSDDRDVCEQGCPGDGNDAETPGEIDLQSKAGESEDGGHDDLEAHDAGAIQEHCKRVSAAVDHGPEGEAEKQDEGRRDARADPPGEQAMGNEQHSKGRDRGEAKNQNKRAPKSSADPWDVAARDGFAIGGPERRDQHGDHQGNQGEHALRDRVIGDAGGSQSAGDDEVVGGKCDGHHQLEDEEHGPESDDARDSITRDELATGPQIGPADDKKVKRVERSCRDRSSGKGGDKKRQTGVHADSGDDASQSGEAAEYLPQIHAKALLQAQLRTLHQVKRNVEGETEGEDHQRRSCLGVCLSRSDAKNVRPGDPGESGGKQREQQKPNRAEDGKTAGDGGADAVEVILAEGVGDRVEDSIADAEIGEVGHGKHGADGHPEAESLIAEVVNREGDGDKRR